MDGIALTIWILVQLAFDGRPSMNEGLRQSQDDIGFMQIPTVSQFRMRWCGSFRIKLIPFIQTSRRDFGERCFCTEASKPRSGHEWHPIPRSMFMGFLRIALEMEASTIPAPCKSQLATPATRGRSLFV